MPFTPYHLGSALFFGLILRKYLNLWAFLIGAVVLDIEGFTVLLFNLQYPLHGYLHTFLGGLLVAVVLTLALYYSLPKVSPNLPFLQFGGKISLVSIGVGSLLGVFSHLLLDSFLYPEMRPFFPLKSNPLLGLVSSPYVYNFCLASFLLGFILVILIVIKENPER